MMQDLLVNYFDEVCKPVRFLINLVPEDKYDWSPVDSMMTLGKLTTHLADTPKLIYPAATGDWPTEFTPAQPEPKADALNRFDKYVEEATNVLKQFDPSKYGETVKAPWGAEGTKFMMVMSMIDHIIHHKMQLFAYLKQLGYSLGSMELYYGLPSEQ